MTMKRYMIERDIPGIGAMSVTELCGAARASNQALSQLAPKVQWNHSYVSRTSALVTANVLGRPATRSRPLTSQVTSIRREAPSC